MRRNRDTVTKDEARRRYNQDSRRTKSYLDGTGIPRDKTVDEALIRHTWLALIRVSIQALFILQHIGNYRFCPTSRVELSAGVQFGPSERNVSW